MKTDDAAFEQELGLTVGMHQDGSTIYEFKSLIEYEIVSRTLRRHLSGFPALRNRQNSQWPNRYCPFPMRKAHDDD
jgi:hypothetical protein